MAYMKSSLNTTLINNHGTNLASGVSCFLSDNGTYSKWYCYNHTPVAVWFHCMSYVVTSTSIQKDQITGKVTYFKTGQQIFKVLHMHGVSEAFENRIVVFKVYMSWRNLKKNPVSLPDTSSSFFFRNKSGKLSAIFYYLIFIFTWCVSKKSRFTEIILVLNYTKHWYY